MEATMANLIQYPLLPAAIQHDLRFLRTKVRDINDQNIHKGADRYTSARMMLCSLDGVFSLSAGDGQILIGVNAGGAVEIALNQAILQIRVMPHLPLGIKTEPRTVLHLASGVPTVFDTNALAFALNILRRAKSRCDEIDKHGAYYATWMPTWTNNKTRWGSDWYHYYRHAGTKPPEVERWVQDHSIRGVNGAVAPVSPQK
jgi:hypothetical protein